MGDVSALATRAPRHRRALALASRSAPGLVLIAALVVLWQLVAVEAPERWLPPFTEVAATYVELATGPALLDDIIPSVERTLAGLTLAIAIGVAVGVPLGHLRWVDPWVRPLLEFGRALPAITVLPVALVLFGGGEAMRIFLIAFGAVFPVLWNAIDGARRVPHELVDAARVAGAGRVAVLVRVVLPAALPQIFTGIRIGLGLALIMMVISEMVAAPNGLGALIFESQRRFDVSTTYAGVLLLGTVGALLNALLLRIDRVALRWHHGLRSSVR